MRSYRKRGRKPEGMNLDVAVKRFQRCIRYSKTYRRTSFFPVPLKIFKSLFVEVLVEKRNRYSMQVNGCRRRTADVALSVILRRLHTNLPILKVKHRSTVS